jgi:Vacuolar-sorting-associated 13 protein C-terminal
MEQISANYVNELMKGTYSVIASLNILGNPSQIAKQFSGGMEQMFDEQKVGSRGANIAKGAKVIGSNVVSR